MHEIVDEKGEWADFALYITLAALGLPDVGYVAIPVKLDNFKESVEPRHEISFRLHARRSPEAFPVFEGGIGIDSTGPSNSLLWLGGNYEVPLGGFGAILNNTMAHGTAERSLWNMLVELGDAIQARVERREMAGARYRLIFNTGD